jgi:hypothetical protein
MFLLLSVGLGNLRKIGPFSSSILVGFPNHVFVGQVDFVLTGGDYDFFTIEFKCSKHPIQLW